MATFKNLPYNTSRLFLLAARVTNEHPASLFMIQRILIDLKIYRSVHYAEIFILVYIHTHTYPGRLFEQKNRTSFFCFESFPVVDTPLPG